MNECKKNNKKVILVKLQSSNVMFILADYSKHTLTLIEIILLILLI
jgi:hypothetical protein